MARQGTLSLFMFVDALGWEIAQRYPLLEDVLGVRAPVASALGYSSTCIPTILTGLSPRDHGHFSFFHFDPAGSPFKGLAPLRHLPRGLTDRGRVRRLLSRGLQRVLGYSGYFQLYNVPFEHLPLLDYSEKRDLYQAGGINSGAPTIFDELRRLGIRASVSDWRRSEEANLEAMAAALEGGTPPAFAYLYLAELDSVLHAHGGRSVAAAEKIRWYDRQLRRLVQRAERRYAEVRVHLLSDHGMADVREVCDLIAAIERLGLAHGRDYVAIYDSTMARFWYRSDAARRRIDDALASVPQGRALTELEVASFGCDFADGRQGDRLFLVKPGVLICPSYMGLQRIAGMHGYDPADRDSTALYASNVEADPRPTDLRGFFPLMLAEAMRASGGVTPTDLVQEAS